VKSDYFSFVSYAKYGIKGPKIVKIKPYVK
jgi:hypothetical protein